MGIKEITLRGVVLGVFITLIFTAAQVYLGLKVGLTFATSIPAAVISMALLQFFKGASIQENNIVQTIASAAGTIASVIFVLPGLIILGWWQEVPFWMSFLACALGGVLGVMYTIPLRRSLVRDSSLPYPEGVAAAEVLKVGTSSKSGALEGKIGFRALVIGTLASALFAAVKAAKLMAAEIVGFFKLKVGTKVIATGLAGDASLALFGAGHLMGLTVGIAMLTGLFIAWGVAVPILSTIFPMPDLSAADHAGTLWSKKVRFIGAGTIGVAALWTLAKLALPVMRGLGESLKESTKKSKINVANTPDTDRDLPLGLVFLITIGSLVPAGFLMAAFLQATAIEPSFVALSITGVVFLGLAGMMAAAVCGYMAGLIGSSNSPVSGIAILTVLGAAFCIMAVLGQKLFDPEVAKAAIAFSLFVTTIVLAVAVIGNDNLQDLKTGQLVGASPWKQQIALIIGVIAGSCVVPIVLEILNKTYGFAGDPNYSAITNEPLPAPQATLITTLAKGVVGGILPLDLLAIGALIGGGLIIIDAVLVKKTGDKASLPPLGVGLAIYLPAAVTAPVVAGAIGGYFFQKLADKTAYGEIIKRLGILIMSGFIVGESLFNVALAAFIWLSGNASPLAVFGAVGEHMGTFIALGTMVLSVLVLYRWAFAAAKAVKPDAS